MITHIALAILSDRIRVSSNYLIQAFEHQHVPANFLADSAAGAFLEHVTAKEVPLFARDNFQRAKRWIEACRRQHTDCQNFHKNTVSDRHQRPTRVIEVVGTKLRLRCDLGSDHFDYLVLSHMWDPDPSRQLRLLGENLEKFQQEIPRAELEATSTFKEAIQITRVLGCRYLWIDSLCIIQDSPSDWEYEARRMAIVYGNALCNLAFIFPPNKEESVVEPQPRKDTRSWSPCILRAASSSQRGVYLEGDMRNWRRHLDGGLPWLKQHHWPLFGRAWTFQEYLLCPRTLLIGHENLMWHCSEHFYDEILGPISERHKTTNVNPKRGKDMGKSRYFPHSIREITTATSLSVPGLLSFMKDWQDLVNEYRERRLTFAKDRVIAFAGIARAFQTIGKLTYLAGAWREILPLCLLWCIDKKSEAVVREQNKIPQGEMPAGIWAGQIEEHVVQSAPSWSWFSVPIYKVYQPRFLFDVDEVFVRSKSYLPTPLVYWDDIYWAKTRAFQFAYEPTNHFPEPKGFFDFAGLQVTLEIPILPIKADLPKDFNDQLALIRETCSSPDDQDLFWLPEFEYFPDIPAGRKSPPRNAVYALMAEFQTVRVAGIWNVQRRMAGLMLVPGEQAGTWVRVGAWKLRLKIKNIPVNPENMASVAQRWRQYSVISAKWNIGSITLG